MDSVYRGLAAPRQSIPMGRADIDPADRPGAALSGLAREALDAGAFPEAAAPAPPVRAGRAAPAPRPDDHDDGFDPENEVHLPDGDEPGHDEPGHDDGLDT